MRDNISISSYDKCIKWLYTTNCNVASYFDRNRLFIHFDIGLVVSLLAIKCSLYKEQMLNTLYSCIITDVLLIMTAGYVNMRLSLMPMLHCFCMMETKDVIMNNMSNVDMYLSCDHTQQVTAPTPFTLSSFIINTTHSFVVFQIDECLILGNVKLLSLVWGTDFNFYKKRALQYIPSLVRAPLGALIEDKFLCSFMQRCINQIFTQGKFTVSDSVEALGFSVISVPSNPFYKYAVWGVEKLCGGQGEPLSKWAVLGCKAVVILGFALIIGMLQSEEQTQEIQPV